MTNMEETYTEYKLRVEEALGQQNLLVVDFLGSNFEIVEGTLRI